MHLLIINPNPDCYTNPTIVYLLSRLIKNKQVTITMVMQPQAGEIPDEFGAIYHYKFNQFGITWSKKFWRWLPMLREYKELISYCRIHKLEKILAVDPGGVIIGGRLKKFLKKTELHYISFEIFFQDELEKFPYYKKIKKKEVYYSRICDVIVIQDPERKKLLFAENKLEEVHLKVFYVPVAPIVTSKEFQNSKLFFRKKLGIEEDEVILLHSGSVAKWSGAEWLIELLQQGLPPKFRLVIHSKHKLSKEHSLHAELIRMHHEGYPVILHDDAFTDYTTYLEFLKCADYGLAFYIADSASPYTGKNIEEIGLASGKFGCYMSLGIPAIVTTARIYTELNLKYKFGFVVNDTIELSQMLINHYNYYFDENKIITLYNTELNPEKFGRLYLEELLN